MKYAIPIQDMDVFASIKSDEQMRILAWLDALTAFDQAADKDRAAGDISREYGHQIKVSRPTIYRARARYHIHGWRGVAHKARLPHSPSSGSLPRSFIDFLAQLCCANQRAWAPAYRALFFDHLNIGRVIPGYETDWRGIWRMEHPGHSIPAQSPYKPHTCTPRGWSIKNLSRHIPTEYQRIAARIGTAAAKDLLPSIPTTRVGLQFGQVYQMDDVHHDTKVKLATNREAHEVVEMGAIELLTAHYCTHGMKPVRERDDGSKEKLSEALTRYLIADIICRLGYHPAGCTIIGEHGTASLPKDLVGVLARWTRGIVAFEAGGIMNRPIARGLHLGLSRGNFRIKAALESHHNLKKNELAALGGQKGADPEHAPENLESRKAEHKWIMRAFVALVHTNPEAALALESDFPEYHSYRRAVTLLYDRINDRETHQIEGWEECGFLAEEWRPHPSSDWMPIALIDAMSDPEAQACRTLYRADPANRHRYRRLSPREAWDRVRDRAQRQNQIIVQPLACAAQILGAALGDIQPVSRHGTIDIRDPEIASQTHQVAAIVTDPAGHVRQLPRGTSWLCHINPFNFSIALISDLQGAYVGTAPIMRAGCKTDQDAYAQNIKILSQIQSAEIRRIAPVAQQRLDQRYEQLANNVAALTGRDPQELIDHHLAGLTPQRAPSQPQHAGDVADFLPQRPSHDDAAPAYRTTPAADLAEIV